MLALSPEMARAGISLRPYEDSDRAFLRALYAAERPDAALLAHWPKGQLEAFFDSQFQFQDTHYRRYYPDADFLIVEEKGAPIGRVILERAAGGWHFLDMGFVPEQRGRGIGSALFRAVLAAAAEAGAPSVGLHVEIDNPARALYLRLGFVETEDLGTHIAMLWTNPQLKTAS